VFFGLFFFGRGSIICH